MTGRIRRVARFHPAVVRAAIQTNRPTEIILNHLDYVDAECGETNGLTANVTKFVKVVESKIGNVIDAFGLGPASLVSRSSVSERRAAG